MCRPTVSGASSPSPAQSMAKKLFSFRFDQKRFRFLPIAWSVTHHNIFNGVGVGEGMGVDVDVGLKISILRKSAFLSRHNSMGFICVCHFFPFHFCFFFSCLDSLFFFHFDSVSHQLPAPLSIVFYSRCPPEPALWPSLSMCSACPVGQLMRVLAVLDLKSLVSELLWKAQNECSGHLYL